jgi:hypothetical protein
VTTLNRQAILRLVLGGVLLLCGCSAKQEGQKAPAPEQNRREEKKASAADLRRRYAAADSDNDRRAVCITAMDEGLIRRGGPVSAADEIFGTRFGESLPAGDEPYRWGTVRFSPQVESPPSPNGGVVKAVDFVGWSLGLQYDRQGRILIHRLSNVNKSPGIPPPDDKRQALVAELRRLYGEAMTEGGRRDVCLRAIDEGVIRNAGNVSEVDEVLGTHLAGDLPSRKEGSRKATVDLAPPSRGPDDSTAAAPAGWFFAVEYGDDGYVIDYSLSTH